MLTFIYDFLFKAFDTDRFHFIEGDTDSLYWAISGMISEDKEL
jgi:DNA polymerase elongation subunit (family B)